MVAGSVGFLCCRISVLCTCARAGGGGGGGGGRGGGGGGGGDDDDDPFLPEMHRPEERMCTQLYGIVTSSTPPARKIIRIVLKKEFAQADFLKMNMNMHEMMRKMRKMMKMNMNMHADFIKM